MLYKSLRFILFACGLFFFSIEGRAQDKIYLDDGTVIEAKVKEISPRSIIYRRWDNQDGADYVLTRKEVTRIVYENGTEERIVTRNERPNPFNRNFAPREDRRGNGDMKAKKMNAAYGKNIIAVAPMQMTNESVAGVGIQYERFLDQSGSFSFYLPVAVAFYDDEVRNPISGGPSLIESRTFTYLYPGAKFYPGGSGRRASYSVGPSFVVGFGDKFKERRVIDPGTGSIMYRYDEASIFKAGFMVNNGVNLQPTPKLYVGLEFGFGILYYNNEESDYVVGDEPIVQFNFKMGYRF
jgi:hypothetical protein